MGEEGRHSHIIETIPATVNEESKVSNSMLVLGEGE